MLKAILNDGILCAQTLLQCDWRIGFSDSLGKRFVGIGKGI